MADLRVVRAEQIGVGRVVAKQRSALAQGEDLGAIHPLAEQPNSIGGAVRPDDFDIRTAQLRITSEHSLEYLDTLGQVRLTDSGPRIDLAQEDDPQAMRAGLLLASQKYGGEIFITGSLAFREMAAKEAWRMGIKVRNPELTSLTAEKSMNQEMEM